jgi:hypothetical protein
MRPRERWDGDVRGAGVGSAAAAVPRLHELLALARRPDWVAEQPDVHLEGHVRSAAERVGLSVAATRTAPDGSFDVTLVHPPAMNRRAVRVAAWGVVAAVAEETTHVRETTGPAGTELHVVTGTLDAPGGFATHGHHLVLRLVPGR